MKSKLTFKGFKKWLMGSHERTSPVAYFVFYFVLTGIGFIYVYPILYMVINAFMSPADLADPSVSWIPTELYWGNFKAAFETLDFFKTFSNTFLVTVGPVILQTIVCSIIGFGLARFEFPLKKIWIGLIVLTFLFPIQLMLTPRYALYYDYGIIETVLPAYLPAAFGQGLRSAIFILVYYMFFNSYPLSFDEAASIDGANSLSIYWKIALPMSKGATVLSLLFSSVWYWNETTQSAMFFGTKYTTLPLQLANLEARFTSLFGKNDNPAVDSATRFNQSTSMAGTMLSILPLVIFYICLQRQFVESIDRTGIAGE